VLGLVADDLTGAGDASVQFAKRGWVTFLTLARLKTEVPPVVPGFSRAVIAVTTDSRALSNESAEKLTADAVSALLDLGVDQLFLKIDSTMRGSVPGQIAGALAAWRPRHPDARAFVCPAYPRMGRTVESNRLLVKGEPVERTAIGRDPVTPVLTSDMSELLPASKHITVVDAATDADLMAIAASIAAAGPSVVPVGSGGLAAALSDIWAERAGSAGGVQRHPGHGFLPKRKNSRILLQVSSLNPVSRAQVERLKAAFPDVVVLSPPAERGDSLAGPESRTRPTDVAADLARRCAEHIECDQWDVIGLVGGDGARETLRRLGASGIRIVDSLLEGIPLGVVAGGRADGMPVFTKAGGFGAEDALVRCVERLKA
jgi:D-threonate/D-erythronate kinase